MDKKKPYKILIADDDPDVLVIIQRKLEREGYSCVTAFDGKEAYSKFESEKPDVIILDINMPRLNGFQVLEKIRQKKESVYRPVIIVSASGELEIIKKGFSLEADQYLTKPIVLNVLMRGIETMISLIPLKSQDNPDIAAMP